MKQIYNIYVFLLISLLFATTACTDDQVNRENGSSVFFLEIDLSTPLSETKTLSVNEEYLIKDITLLLFDNQTEELIAVPGSSQLSLTSPGDIRNVKLTLDKKTFLNQTIQVVVLANMEDNLEIQSINLTPGRTKQDILNDLKYIINGNWPILENDFRSFPMYGIFSSYLNGLNINKTVNMLRAVARIQFFVNNGQGLTYDDAGSDGELFRLSSVSVYYTRKGGYAAPLVPFTNETDYIAQTSGTEDFEQRDINSPLIYSVPNTDKYAFRQTIYLPENNNINPKESDEPVCMIVGGFFKGALTPCYYKVNFADDVSAYDIIRNYTYDFNITNVTKKGTSTPEEALSESTDMIIEIVAWNEISAADTDLSVYELNVSQSVFVVDHQGSTETLDVSTTHFSNEWVIDQSSITVNWFSASKNQSGDGVLLKIDQNPDDYLRVASFTITSGKLTKLIYVSQLQEKTANCYIVSEPGIHGLKATVIGNGSYGTLYEEYDNKGNVTATVNLANYLGNSNYNADGSINKDAISTARLIWQSRPGLITAVGGNVTAGESLLNEYDILSYTVGEPLSGELGGNAVIGIYDDADNVLWSWHIWVIWGYIPENNLLHFLTTGVRSGFYFMDRNLGAFNNQVSDANAYGLLYQWGRKDPIRGVQAHGNDNPYPTYGFTGESLDYTEDNSDGWYSPTAFNDVLTSVRNPMKYSSTWGRGASSNSPHLWGNGNGGDGVGKDVVIFPEGHKSIYDPCPPGYKVPSINGFYFGIYGKHADCVYGDNGALKSLDNYCDIVANGYYIYYFGSYKGYENYYTWMPMAPYCNGIKNGGDIIYTTAGDKERFAFTWLNAGEGTGANAFPVIWHPENFHIHNYGSDTDTKEKGGTVRCVKETDPNRVSYTVPEKIVLQNASGSNFNFAVSTNLSWYVEKNNLQYDWFTAVKSGDNVLVTATSQNMDMVDRYGYVTIVFSNGEKAQVKIIQNAYNITISANTITLDYRANRSGSITFVAPMGAEISETVSGWFTPQLTVSGSTYTLMVTSLTMNIGAESRNSTVTIRLHDSSNYEFTVSIIQNKTSIIPVPSSLSLNKAIGRTASFNVSKDIPAGINWEILSTPWFATDINPLSGTTNGNNQAVTVTTTDQNTTGSDRSDDLVIRFTAPDGYRDDYIIKVTQSK